MKKKALSLPEILIALALAAVVFASAAGVMSSSGRQTTKSRNYSFAAGLARYIAQKLYVTKYDDIKDVAPCSPCAAKDNPYFMPFANTGQLKSTQTGITKEAFNGLYGFLMNNHFKYSLSVGEVFYTNEKTNDGADLANTRADGAKAVSIEITWVEGGRCMMYRTHVYVTSL